MGKELADGPRSREDLAYGMADYAWREGTMYVPASFFASQEEVEIARSLTDEEKHEAMLRSSNDLATLAKAELENDPKAAALARDLRLRRLRPPFDEARPQTRTTPPQTRTTPRPALGRRVPRARAPRPRQGVRRKARTAARDGPSDSDEPPPPLGGSQASRAA
jgi:hypothetical protein